MDYGGRVDVVGGEFSASGMIAGFGMLLILFVVIPVIGTLWDKYKQRGKY